MTLNDSTQLFRVRGERFRSSKKSGSPYHAYIRSTQPSDLQSRIQGLGYLRTRSLGGERVGVCKAMMARE
jgi:hypothetical protein